MFLGNDSQRKVNQDHNDLEPQQVFMDKMAAKREKLSEKKFEVPVKKRKLWLLFAFFLIVMLLFLGKTFDYQVLEHDKYLALAEDNKDISYLVKANRGVMYDRDGNQLLSNEGSFDLVCYKRRLPDDPVGRDKLIEEIASLTEKKKEKIKSEIQETEFNRVLLSKDLSHRQLIRARTKLTDKPSINIEENAIRHYKYGELFAHVIGYTGKISQEELRNRENYSPLSYIGKSGLEKSYEEVLKGKPGTEKIKKDARGNFLSKELVSEPQPGKSLTLSIDKDLQKKSTEALKKILEESGSKKGAIMATNPQNGAVLSLVSLPSFDPNLFSQGITEEEYQEIQDSPGDPLFNQVVAGNFPTGSIIKPLIAVGALEEGIVTPNTTIDCKGKIVVENPYYDEEDNSDVQKKWVYKDWKTHGVTDIKKAIAESCNVFFYTLGGGHEDFEGLGARKVKEWIEKFSWGHRTGIDLPSESKGNLPEIDSDWILGRTYHFSIGQGFFAIPPLQVNTAFGAIANGGTLYRPRLVKEIIGKEGAEPQEKKIIREDFAGEENFEVVREGMRQAVTSPEGTAHLLNDLSVTAAAKTGTAEVGSPDYDYYHDWIVAFAPYEDPEIVLTVLVEEVEGQQITANKTGKEILEYYFKKDKENSTTTESGT